MLANPEGAVLALGGGPGVREITPAILSRARGVVIGAMDLMPASQRARAPLMMDEDMLIRAVRYQTLRASLGFPDYAVSVAADSWASIHAEYCGVALNV
jgi:hypothetical protein